MCLEPTIAQLPADYLNNEAFCGNEILHNHDLALVVPERPDRGMGSSSQLSSNGEQLAKISRSGLIDSESRSKRWIQTERTCSSRAQLGYFKVTKSSSKPSKANKRVTYSLCMRMGSHEFKFFRQIGRVCSAILTISTQNIYAVEKWSDGWAVISCMDDKLASW